MNSFSKKALIALLPKSYILKSAYEDGTIVCGENKSGYGGRGVFLFGADLEYELRLLPELLTSGATFIDIGANVGAFTMRAASIVGATGTVVSLEPFPRMADMLLSNARQNKFQNIRLRVCCASDRDGNSNFWMKDDRPNSFTLLETPGAWNYNVPTVSIDSLVRQESLSPALIKIDAEGAENQIIQGASQTLATFRPALIVEDIFTKEHLMPDGYIAYRVKDSHNLLLLHSSSPLASKVASLGFKKI